jgi:membrane protease YdiL (CAAX protease family)
MLGEEVLIVLALSLLASAVYAALSFLEAPVNSSQQVATVAQTPRLVDQLVDIVFALPPVWLVFYLLRRNREDAGTIGMRWDRPAFDVGAGLVLSVLVGVVGIAGYVLAVRVGHNRLVIPVPPLGQWWTYPVLVLSSLENALLEETIAVGFLITRLRQMRFGAASAVGLSALLRGSYHLYQGWGGFLGNIAMGLLFGWLFLRWRRTWPLVMAHTLLDVGAGVLYILFTPQLLRLLGL